MISPHLGIKALVIISIGWLLLPDEAAALQENFSICENGFTFNGQLSSTASAEVWKNPEIQNPMTRTDGSWMQLIPPKSALQTWGGYPAKWEFVSTNDCQIVARPENPRPALLDHYNSDLRWYWLLSGHLQPYFLTGGRMSVLSSTAGSFTQQPTPQLKPWRCDARLGLGWVCQLNRQTSLQSEALMDFPGPANWLPCPEFCRGYAWMRVAGEFETMITLRFCI